MGKVAMVDALESAPQNGLQIARTCLVVSAPQAVVDA